MYETMVFLGDGRPPGDDQSAISRDYAEIWRGAEKGRLLQDSGDGSERKKPGSRPPFDTEMVRETKESARSDLAIGGAELAALAFSGQLGRRVSFCFSIRSWWEEGSRRFRTRSRAPNLICSMRAGFDNGVVHLPLTA